MKYFEEGIELAVVIHARNIIEASSDMTRSRPRAGFAGSIARAHPLLRHVFADGGYGGPKLRDALEKLHKWTVQTDSVAQIS